MKKDPFRLTPYQVQWLLIVGFLTVGYAIYLRYLAIEFSSLALACDAGLQTTLCKTRLLVTYLFRNSVFGIVALVIAALHVIRRRLRHRALQYRPFGNSDRTAYFGVCTARACHSVMPSRKYSAQVHSDCQFSGPSLNAV
jgi:hypothetical protein